MQHAPADFGFHGAGFFGRDQAPLHLAFDFGKLVTEDGAGGIKGSFLPAGPQQQPGQANHGGQGKNGNDDPKDQGPSFPSSNSCRQLFSSSDRSVWLAD